MVDWERLERELDGVGSSGRIRRLPRAGRTRRLFAFAAVLVLAAGGVAAGAVVVLRHHPAAAAASSPDAMSAGGLGRQAAAPGTRAAIYAAVLSGGPAPHPLRRPVWVRSTVCDAVPARPSAAACADAQIPATVRRQVVTILGTNVQFAAAPPVPMRPGDAPVVQFGRLILHGDTARVGVETLCGSLCGEGETLRLHFVDAAWQVIGTTGPQWVS